jgi:hypothetical protein
MTKTHKDADRGGIPTTGALEQGHRKGGQATDDAPVAHEASRPHRGSSWPSAPRDRSSSSQWRL